LKVNFSLIFKKNFPFIAKKMLVVASFRSERKGRERTREKGGVELYSKRERDRQRERVCVRVCVYMCVCVCERHAEFESKKVK